MKNAFLFLTVCLLFTACIKDPFQTTTATNNNTTPPTPNACPTADGALWAVKSITTQNTIQGVPPISITLGTGIGFFASNGLAANPMTRVEVGTVSINGTQADYIGETYLATASTTNPTGVDFGNGVTWEVSGANGFGAFTHTPTNNFPTVTEITSPDVVDKANGYTLTCSTVSGADSTLFLVGNVVKTLAGNATTCTFSASDLSGSDNGTSLVQIVPYTMSSAVLGGKNICFGKEMVQQQSVTIQ